MISACGLVCSNCNFYNNACKGCYHVKGVTFWAKDHTKKGICPLFDCAIYLKRIEHCGKCSELPCQKFHDLKDPNISNKEHIESISKRVEILRNQN